MDSTIINMGGNKPLRFILAIEKDMLTPSWMTTVDKIWLRVVAVKRRAQLLRVWSDSADTLSRPSGNSACSRGRISGRGR